MFWNILIILTNDLQLGSKIYKNLRIFNVRFENLQKFTNFQRKVRKFTNLFSFTAFSLNSFVWLFLLGFS